MWGRMYPHAVLLIFMDIILKISCQGNGSITFLIDDTSSMDDDIKQVRKSVHRIKDIVLHEKSSLIDTMVLVTFNDPGVSERVVTKDPNEFKNALDEIRVHNEAKRPYLDCWEPAMKGLLLALKKSKNDSYIFVFTDAPAKDYIDSQSVIELCQQKQTQIIFVLTGTLCSKFTYVPAAIDSYFDIATACSGLAIFVNKNEVDKVFGPIEEIIKGNKTVITTATIPAGVSKNIPFTIDGYTDYVIIYSSGKNVTLKINQRSISSKAIMWTDNVKVLKLTNIKPGSYVATVKGSSRTTIAIVGRTDFFFNHGFSESKPKSLSDTLPQPMSDDTKVYLSISVTDEKHSVKMESAQFLDMDEKPILTKMPLSEISKDFYVTDQFIAPSQRFKVAVNGIVKATGQSITRISKIPVTPPPPKIAPKVQGISTIKVNKGETVQIECKVVRGFPAPKITWLFKDKSSSTFTPIPKVSDTVLVINNVGGKDDGKYKCKAENVKGKDELVTTLHVQDPPKILSSVSTIYEGTEGDASLKIPCDATGLPKPSITWKLNDRVINQYPKYSIENGALIIRDPKLSDKNSYKCEAKNEIGAASAIFRTYIRQKPKVLGVAAKQVRLGQAASIECTVIKGEPKPTITWHFMDNTGLKFIKIDGSEKVLHISRAENKHAGSYKCVAENKVGTDEHITTLEVLDKPKIVSSVTTVYQSTEGEASLKIPCVTTGVPKPSITWKLNDGVINPSTKYFIVDGTLIIKDPKLSDSNSYTCEARNLLGVVSAIFKTYIRQKPQVSGVRAKQVKVGASASIECTIVKGEPKPTITWHFMDYSSVKFVSIAGSDKVLQISRVEHKHAGLYKCVAQNSVGSDEHNTTLEVQEAPQVTGVAAKKVRIGSPTSIECTIKKGEPKPTITWQFMNKLSSKFVTIAGSKRVLYISRVEHKDAGRYKCVAQNSVGRDEHITTLEVQEAPQVTGVAAKNVRIGSPTNIECTVVKGEPKPTITWQFMNGSSTKFVSIAGSDKELDISRVESKHAGRYKCVAQNSVGSDEHVTTLVVQDLPKIVSSVSTIYLSTEGDALMRIPCTATGLPKPSITWKLDGRVINPSEKYSVNDGDGTLVIRDPKVSDTNSYTCEAKNEVGAVSATIKTYIRQKPQVSGDSVKQATIGTAASIECKVNKGEPKPTITWQFMNKLSSKFLTIPGTERVLYISRVELKDAGRYKCVAQNSVGRDEHITTLEVQEAPQVTGVAAKKVRIGSPTSIECTVVKGEPKPTITWQFMNGSSTKFVSIAGSDKELHISRMESIQAGRYKCVAQNSIGSDEHVTILVVQDLPKIVSSVSTIYLSTEGDALMRIPCTATGLPKPSIIWKLDGHVIKRSEKYSVDEGILVIRDPKVSDTKSYTCEAKNEVGVVSATIKTYIRQKPQVSGDAVKQATVGTAASIECKVNKGEPKPTITWQFMNNLSSKFVTIAGSERVLYISRVEHKDAGRYKCVAQNSVGSDEHITTLEVQEAPQVTGDAAKKVRIGSSTSIECTIVKGVPKPTMTWQFMDDSSAKFVSIAGSDKELHFSRVEHKHAGQYKCVAQNRVGIDEHITTLMVQDPPKIVSSGSTNYQSIEGDDLLRIPCVATGLPKPSIMWKLNGRIISKSEKFTIEDGTLIIRSPKVSDTNSYTCEAKNEVGTDSATFKTYIRQVPITIGAPATKVRIGSAAKIVCTVKGEPKPTIKWEFMDNFSSKFLSIPGSGEVLLISKVESKHAGRYKCIAQNNVGNNEHVTTLEVQDLPKIISSVPTTIQSTEGDALLRIPCAASGLPAPGITWKLNGLVIKPSEKYIIEDGTLIIRDPKVSDTNSYTCEAKNEVGEVSATFKAYIRQIPKLKGVDSKNVRIGHPVNIECIIDQGEPTPKISWQFMDKNASKFVPIAGSENILHISNAEDKHAGRYKCVAQNIIGSDEHVTTLIVEYVPGITINSTTIDGILGDLALRIPCKVVGVPPPVITWKKNGNAIIPNEKYLFEDGALVIVKPAASDSSSYTCEAKNPMGSTSATFQATVRRYPKNFGTEHYVYLKEGETKKIECEAYTSESQSIKWFATKEDWLPSTTSSPPDSPETATELISKAFSSTSRTNELNNKEPYIQIANASLSDHDGNYTCHVSDKHGNTQTHTYMVDVGIAPKFISEDNSLSNWRGDITDIMQYCDIELSAKPTPEVQWSFNGKVLTDLNSAGVGYYTCNVSNVHGYVLKRFDVKSSACLINRSLQNAPYTPLVLNDKGFWNKLETTKYYTIIEQELKITLSCPSRKETSNSFKIFPKKSTLEAICYKGDSFIVDDKTYKLSDLQCTNSFQPSVIKKKTKCSTETSEVIRVGYNVPDFLEAYEVCFDHKSNMPLYTRILMTETNNNGLRSVHNWYTYPGIDSEKTERGFTCKDASSSCCYSKSQLVNAIDFNDGPAKKSTFIDPLNAIAAWIPCDTSKSSWEDINDMVRSQLPNYLDIVVWSGTHTLQEKNGAVYPRYLWKVVRLADKEVMAIVYVNDPNPTKSDIKCKTPDICNKYEDWIVSSDSTYCCSLPDFLKSFDFHNTDIGEILDAALNKMKKKS